MKTAVHGMPRIGAGRQLKWALEAYWGGRSGREDLEGAAAQIRQQNWLVLAQAEVDFVPANDFSLYDHVLDAALAVGALPPRFAMAAPAAGADELARYFAMARGGELGGLQVAPLELTKWFDTNYHHLVPEVGPETTFEANWAKIAGELREAAALGVTVTPVLLGPFTLLDRSSSQASGFDRLDLLDPLLETYLELVSRLAGAGANWVRLDEPALVEDRSPDELAAFARAYRRLAEATTRPRLAVSTFFGHVGEAMTVLRDVPIDGVGLDFCAGRENLELLAESCGLGEKTLFAGVVDGRNVWANDLGASLDLLEPLGAHCGELVVSSSCSFLHVPLSVQHETGVDPEVRPWLAFAKEKLTELGTLARGLDEGRTAIADALEANRAAFAARRNSQFVHNAAVRRATAAAPDDPRRAASLVERVDAQRIALELPAFPTTTIGSFPQTPELRAVRASWRVGATSDDDYDAAVRAEINRVIALQEDLGLDVMVHGEPERDDMVRYFAAHLEGFVLPEAGWVQSYGSRCVRPPILVGDVARPAPITVGWTTHAQGQATRVVKGMLTGPVTMLRWSFVRDDQPLAETAVQLGLAVAEELTDLQRAGIRAVQIDEPALPEGLPLRRADRPGYLAWATRAVRLAAHPAAPATQVHTHMCYAEFGEVLGVIEDMDVDVVSFEAARSQMREFGALGGIRFAGGLGPGTYDVHSPRVPDVGEIEGLLRRAVDVIPPDRLWVNPDCGLKTRRYSEVEDALTNMVAAARALRAEMAQAPPSHRSPETDPP